MSYHQYIHKVVVGTMSDWYDIYMIQLFYNPIHLRSDNFRRMVQLECRYNAIPSKIIVYARIYNPDKSFSHLEYGHSIVLN